MVMCPVCPVFNFNQILYHCLSSIAEPLLGIVLKVNLGIKSYLRAGLRVIDGYTLIFSRRMTISRRECDVNVLEHKVEIFMIVMV